MLLLALPVDLQRDEFALGWEGDPKTGLGTILLFGGGLALGGAAVTMGLAR